MNLQTNESARRLAMVTETCAGLEEKLETANSGLKVVRSNASTGPAGIPVKMVFDETIAAGSVRFRDVKYGPRSSW
jgi:hypothetical protein